MKEITKIITPLNSERYDGSDQRHYHMICECCKEVFDMDMDYHDELDEDALKSSNYKINYHYIVFTGICDQCMEKENNEENLKIS